MSHGTEICCIESAQAFQEVCFHLVPLAQRLGFSLLAEHALGERLPPHAQGCDESCTLFELVNWPAAAAILAAGGPAVLHVSWQVAVWTEHGVTRLGFARAAAQGNPAIKAVENKLVRLLEALRH